MTSIEESHTGHGASLEKKHSGLYGKGRPLMVTEEEAFTRARNSPEEALPLCITFSHNDRENPRCWPKWRKWYITIMVSMLNVITYVLNVHTQPL